MLFINDRFNISQKYFDVQVAYQLLVSGADD